MFSRNKKPTGRGEGQGMVWQDTGLGTASEVRDVFGPRPFAAHIPTVGYDYDFHRGVDAPGDLDDPSYSPINGSISRLHFTHFGWQSQVQYNRWTFEDTYSSAEFNLISSSLALTGSRVGSQAFPDVDYFYNTTDRIIHSGSDDWTIELKLLNAISITGALGFGAFDTDNNEFVTLEYDGSVFTVSGSDADGALFADGTTLSQSAQTWLRIEYSQSNFTTEAVPYMKPIIYWRSKDTDATAQEIVIENFNWIDDQTIGRFGNWIQITDSDKRVMLMHFRDLDVNIGDIVTAGQPIGLTGKTGFDTRSGRINSAHVHVEIIEDNEYSYANTDPVNPLKAGYLPRTDVSNNVTVTRIFEDDPDGVHSFKLAVTCSRADQDFDLNEISLTGTSATRSINFDTRAGLNSDNDIPKNNGVYIVPEDFNGDSTSYIVSVFFNTASVGTSFSSAYVKDANGVTLWNE
jgi:hypothetical protein